MSDILAKHFGDKIFYILPNITSKTFPSLESNMGKIIIKVSANFFQYQLVTEEGANVRSAIENDESSEEEDTH